MADTSDGLVLRKPAEGDKPFVLSLKTEAELQRSAQSSARLMRIAAIALAALGAAGVVLAVIRMVG